MQNKRKKHTALIVVLSIFAVLLAAAGVYSHFGGFGTGQCADTAEFSKYAASISEITVPEQTRIVALGEATHGNREFQQLKLDVFQVLVENAGVRAFALEGDFGGCEAVNRYIHGGDGTAADAAAAIGFAIYRTQEMENLIDWMRQYNASAAPGEDLCFYGFDMQRIGYNYQYLLEAARADGLDTARLEEIWNSEENGFDDGYTSDQRTETLTAVQNALPADDALAIHLADILLQNIKLSEVLNDAGAYPALRDRLMAENTLWILEQEQKRGNERIFVSGHNGHIEQFGTYGPEDKVMGNLLADELGDGYFAIGTDFYKTTCNLPKGSDGRRLTHTFYSHDPLAKASKKCGLDVAYLDFSAVPETSALYGQLRDYTWMGSLGESYSPVIMSLLPMSYRVWRSPQTVYDAMIFVANAHPTQIRALSK